MRRNSRASQFSWRKKPPPAGPSPRTGQLSDRQPLVLPCLDNLNLPYADDSNAVTPTSDDLCNTSNTHTMLAHRRRLSSTSYTSRMSPHVMPASRRSSFASHHSRHSYVSHMGDLPGFKERREPTVFMWNTSMKQRSSAAAAAAAAAHPLLPEVIVDKSNDRVSAF